MSKRKAALPSVNEEFEASSNSPNLNKTKQKTVLNNIENHEQVSSQAYSSETPNALFEKRKKISSNFNELSQLIDFQNTQLADNNRLSHINDDTLSCSSVIISSNIIIIYEIKI